MTTKSILEDACEMYTGIMNFTDDDEEEAKLEKAKLRPILLEIDHAKDTCRVQITHKGRTLIHKTLSSSYVDKQTLEDQALKGLLNDIIILGFHKLF
jgi:hypothetical protein